MASAGGIGLFEGKGVCTSRVSPPGPLSISYGHVGLFAGKGPTNGAHLILGEVAGVWVVVVRAQQGGSSLVLAQQGRALPTMYNV
jgi:hypothetical protein